jgi:hypothetical protein
MPAKPSLDAKTKVQPRRTGEAVDVAARYFIYQLYDDTGGHAGVWKALRDDKKAQPSVTRAVERGWAVVRDDGKGRSKVHSASLTDEGRRLARKSLR